MLNRCRAAWIVTMLLATPVMATPVLEVVEVPGDHYAITAVDDADPEVAFWRLKVDVPSGGIYAFEDLTDAGDGSGGHTNYLGASAYNRQCTLLFFDGRGGNVCTRRTPVGGLADRLTFDAEPDGSAFTITYTETAAATGFFHSSYPDGARTLNPGDLLTTITVTIRPPSPDGTIWDWRIACENVSDHDLSPKIWAAEWVQTWILDTIVRAADSDNALADGPWDPDAPLSYGRWTIGDNAAAGLTAGRQFILDYQDGLSIHEDGGGIAQGTWAGFGYLKYSSPFSYETHALAPGATEVHAGQFILDIAGVTAGAPVADAGADQTITAPTPDGTTATLDGTGSTDADGTIVSYAWSENGTPLGSGATPQVDLSVGMHVITLTVTDNDGLTDTDTVVVDVALQGVNRVFYVDYDNGDNTHHGRAPEYPWKHCPGDAAATGIPAGTALAAGDKVIFRGGVHYRGTIYVNASGDADADLVFDGNTDGTFGDGRAIVDGSEALTGWTPCTSPDDAGGSPYWASLYYADLPAGVTIFTENMYEDGQLLMMAQGPDLVDPRYYDDTSTYRSVPETDVTNDSLIDAEFFTQTDPNAWDGAYIHVWANPNQVFTQAVTGYIPAESTILFETVSPGVYTDRPTRYAMTNSFLVLDRPGEYVIDEALGRVYLWPLGESDPNGSAVTVSVRSNGIDVRGNSYVTIQGFRIVKHSSPINSARNGCGIRNYLTASHLTLRDNEIRYQRSMEKYGGIFLSATSDSLVADNIVCDNVRSRGIMVGGVNNVVVNNYLRNNGGTGIYLSGATDCEVRANTVLDHTGTHANGITLYQGCTNCLVFGNIVLRGGCALTTQDSSGLVLAYNVLSSAASGYTVADWGSGGGAYSVDLHYYNNVIMNPAGGVAFSVSGDSQEGLVCKNNIIDGGGPHGADVTHNLYTSLAWSQTPEYGWYPHDGEIVETDKSLIFVDAAAEDYRLVAGSPALDAGTDVGFDADLLGAAVPLGAAVDMGAYEGAVAAGTPGDADGDGDVDLDDFAILKTNFGRTGATAGAAEGDFDTDGDVDLDDFAILKTHFGT